MIDDSQAREAGNKVRNTLHEFKEAVKKARSLGLKVLVRADDENIVADEISIAFIRYEKEY